MTTTDRSVTVIMPAFNAEKTIAASIESVLKQTHRDFELIILDDCSTDRTAELARAYEKQDARVRFLINETNIGVSLTRNRGVELAKHDWVAFLDSDDTWTEDKLEKQLKTADAHPECAIFFTSTAYVFETGKRSHYVLHAPEKVYRKDVLRQNVISCSSSLVRRDALLKHPMKNDRMIHEDMAAWVAILAETPYAVGIDEPLLIYRISKSGKSGNKLKAAKMQWRTYRAAGIGFFTALSCYLVYAWRGVRKYSAI